MAAMIAAIDLSTVCTLNRLKELPDPLAVVKSSLNVLSIFRLQTAANLNEF